MIGIAPLAGVMKRIIAPVAETKSWAYCARHSVLHSRRSAHSVEVSSKLNPPTFGEDYDSLERAQQVEENFSTHFGSSKITNSSTIIFIEPSDGSARE